MFFSIVIATYNCGVFLEDAILSVLSQSCSDFELIIVDGGSTDNSVDIIKKYSKYISWWVSEPDSGQSDAFNKGFSHAKGNYLTWLNADDILLPKTLEIVKNKLLSTNAKWATGNFVRFRDIDKIIIETQWGPHFLPFFLQTFNSPMVIFGPTTFWSREVWAEVGKFDEKLHYSMDSDYWVRIMKAGYSQVRINHDCWAFRMHENSKTAEFGNHKAEEEVKKRKINESKYRIAKVGYKMSKFKRIVGVLFRFIDCSFFVVCYRQFFIKGCKINEKYDINI